MLQGQSIRSGLHRIQYDPVWAPSAPYKVYYNGTAGSCFGSLQAAKLRCGDIYTKWSNPT